MAVRSMAVSVMFSSSVAPIVGRHHARTAAAQELGARIFIDDTLVLIDVGVDDVLGDLIGSMLGSRTSSSRKPA